MKKASSLLVALLAVSLACEKKQEPPAECTVRLAPSADDQTTVQEALIDAVTGDVLCFDDGTYTFTDEISLTTSGVKIRGTFGKAVLDFSGQVSGGQGLLVTGDDFILESITLRDMAGDGVRGNGTTNFTVRNARVLWSAGPSTDNGPYGLYPVGCTNVLVEDSAVSGAADTGIYVGQSTNVVVRNNEVFENVAGIEIENTTSAEVYGNHSHDNTAGILAFNLPNLPVQDGKLALIHDNVVENNNTANFGDPGAIIGVVPAGLGMVIMATDQIEITANTIRGNESGAVLIIGRDTVDIPYNDPAYDAFPETLYIHDNVVADNGLSPHDIMAAIAASVHGEQHLEDFLWDGVVDPAKDNSDGSLSLCIQNNGTATFLDFDATHDFANPSTDATPHDCSQPAVPPVSL